MNSDETKRKRPIALVVDDDMSMRIMERAALEQAGFHVEEADNGTAALASYDRLLPDLLLLDVMMPELDGFAVCAEIRRRPGGDLVPILMVTGLEDIESINRAFEVAATDFIAKPINWGILSHHVRYMHRASSVFAQLKLSEAKNSALLNAIPDTMVRIGRKGIILETQGSIGVAFILSTEELPGKRLDEVLPLNAASHALLSVEKALETGEMQFLEYCNTMHDVTCHFEMRIVVSGKDEVLAIIRDITSRRNAEEQIMRLAYFDSLTGLANRLLLKDTMAKAIARAARSGELVATIFMDLDRFKEINDTLGHTVGDLLLQGVADRLLSSVRKYDGVARISTEEADSLVARMGGDEFIILLTDIETTQEAASVAQRILDSLVQPFTIAGHEIFITASAGITVYPLDSEDVDSLLKYADTAMYQAKNKGRNNFQFYTASMNAAAEERFTMENELRGALRRNEFLLYYQPQLDLRDGTIVGAEVLVRWAHPDKGLVFPQRFIPLAEETALINRLGEWILRNACLQGRQWHDEGLGPLIISVNISSVELRRSSFVESLRNVLRETGLPPHVLQLEVTESIAMENAEAIIETLHHIRAMGVSLSIDDFGTGYSSLSYLKRFPLSTLKIDKIFVADADCNADSAAIVRTIIDMAHNLNLKVIAEGVETAQQLALLKQHRCDQMQGYLFSHPVPADSFRRLLTERVTLSVVTSA